VLAESFSKIPKEKTFLSGNKRPQFYTFFCMKIHRSKIFSKSVSIGYVVMLHSFTFIEHINSMACIIYICKELSITCYFQE